MFKEREKQGVRYLQLTEFAKKGVKAAFTCRKGGVSSGNYNSLNLGLHTEDSRNNVMKNRQIIAEKLAFKLTSVVIAEQVHGCQVHKVTFDDQGSGVLDHGQAIKGIDALITDSKGITLFSFYADCVPLFFMDYKNRAIGLAHAGWRGTLLKIAVKTLKKMEKEFATERANIKVAIGPAISGKNYQVNKEIADRFKEKFKFWPEFIQQNHGKYYLSLKKCNLFSFLEAGLTSKQILYSPLCTYRNSELFFSYRRDNGQTGRMASIIQL